MSGGYWDHSNDSVCRDIFGWELSPDYGEDGHKQSKQAAKLNPLEDRQISEMAWDMFCLLHAFDWYKSEGEDEEFYRKDVKWFKDKWFGNSRKSINQRTIADACNALKEELMKELCV